MLSEPGRVEKIRKLSRQFAEAILSPAGHGGAASRPHSQSPVEESGHDFVNARLHGVKESPTLICSFFWRGQRWRRRRRRCRRRVLVGMSAVGNGSRPKFGPMVTGALLGGVEEDSTASGIDRDALSSVLAVKLEPALQIYVFMSGKITKATRRLR